MKENKLNGYENIVDLSSYFRARNSELDKMYQDYSTPNRDQKNREKFHILQKLSLEIGPEYLEEIQRQLLNKPIVIDEVRTNFFHFFTSTPEFFSSQPWDPMAKRWGLENLNYRKKHYETKNPVVMKYLELEQKQKNSLLTTEEKQLMEKLSQEFEVYEYNILRTNLN